MACLLIAAQVNKPYKERSLWAKKRTVDINNDAINIWTDWDWRHHTRISKGTFNHLKEVLGPYLKKKDTVMRPAVPVGKRLLMTLWYLGTQVDFRSLGALFGVGKSTVCDIVHEACRIMRQVLTKTFVKFPRNQTAFDVVNGFAKLGFPQTIGAIDGTHIPIIAPSENSSDFYNRKGYYSIIMQAVVDHSYKFIDINVGWPGKVHDSRVFRHSSLFEMGNQGFLPEKVLNLNNTHVPVHLIGDAAYTLLPWLMTPFKGKLTEIQEAYNYKLSSARMVVENSFGRLKARFRRLLKRFDGQLPFLLDVIVDCVILHNICEINKDICLEEWFDNEVTRDVENIRALCGNFDGQIGDAKNITKVIAEYLFQ